MEYNAEAESNEEEVNDKQEDKKHIWNTLCLQESGIFEGDPPEYNTQGTQTEPCHQEQPNNKSLDLTAEIQKLNQFRESIEVGNKTKKLLVSSDQKYIKEINFYKDRLDVLEKKIKIYESSGEVQTKHLAERLSREVYLASQVKELTSKVQKLHSENSRLEEERCELEEAENDTRLRCQQLDAEIETLADRLKAMEDSKFAAKRKAKDAKSKANYWESMVNKYEERNYELEERECELRHKLEVMECTTPAVLLFNMWKVMQSNPDLDVKDVIMKKFSTVIDLKRSVTSDSKSRPSSPSACFCQGSRDDVRDKIKTLESEREKLINQKQNMENKVKDLEQELCSLKQSFDGTDITSVKSSDIELIKELQLLKEKEKEMKVKVSELEHREMAYMETLQQADDIWAEMEQSYKKKIFECEENEMKLRQKIQSFERQDERDDRITDLEGNEKRLKDRNSRLEMDIKKLSVSHKKIKDELEMCLSDYEEKLSTAHAQYAGDIEREKRKSKTLSEELEVTKKLKAGAGKQYEDEIASLKEQLSKTRKELIHLDVTNSELREEVYTLESKISEMEKEMDMQKKKDCQAIKDLSRELRTKDQELHLVKSGTVECFCEDNKSDEEPEVSLNEMARRLSAALRSVEVRYCLY